MLRNVLRQHPNLASPEETHFYRWHDPFGTDTANRQLSRNATLIRHRAIDGIEEAEFAKILGKAVTRRDLYRRYMALFIKRNKPEARRWFDKTPQNVFGAAMLAADFPKSRFVHIVRNPLDVVISLRVGKVMKVGDLSGASNYWRESATNLHTLKHAYPARVLELKYEEFTRDPEAHVARVFDFVGEEWMPGLMDSFENKPSAYDHDAELSPRHRAVVRRICGKWATAYGYRI